MSVQNDIRYLNPPTAEAKKKKYCRFKKSGIKFIDYKYSYKTRVWNRIYSKNQSIIISLAANE